MGIPESSKEKRFTYADYLTWPENERWELIEGIPFDMTPAPTPIHQRLLVELSAQFANLLRGKPCHPFIAPFDVRLPGRKEADTEAATVVQPDLAVVCDRAKLDRRGCFGAPDYILEIVSPSTAGRDQIEKVALYEKHGVREYWILHPIDRTLQIRLLQTDGTYSSVAIREARGLVPIQALPGLAVDFDPAFEAIAGLPEADDSAAALPQRTRSESDTAG